jgi:lipid II:glycine glycyltransferase (peptidoglycan interpeptide bridge formation enzyme)
MRPATTDEVERWDELVVANPSGGDILQTRTWAEFKSGWGWQPRYYVAELRQQTVACVFLVRSIPGLGDLWYAPNGPGVCDSRVLVEMFEDRSVFADAFLLQIEPVVLAAADVSGWTHAGLRQAPANIQPTWATIFVDLRPDEDELFASFKRGARYNVRLAERRGIVVRRVDVDDDSMAVMHGLMAKTQARAGFMLRPRSYCENYWRLQHARGQGQMFFAYLGDEVVAGVFATYLGKRGWYKDGGSTREHSNLKAPYLLQWEVMRWLKGKGVETYDLYAVPPGGRSDPQHPLYGLYMFKSRFCDEVTVLVGTWEVPLRPLEVCVWDEVWRPIFSRRRDYFY